MENVKFILLIGREKKAVLLKEKFEDFKRQLPSNIQKKLVDGKHIFSFQEKAFKLPCFFNSETYAIIKSEIENRNYKPNTLISLSLEAVNEYPEFETKRELNIAEKYDRALDNSIATLENSLIARISNKVLVESKEAYEMIRRNRQLQQQQNLQEEVPKNILCKQCFNPASTGNMFICGECVNFTLCSRCEACNPHDITHTFVMITQPLADDLRKYDCCVVENKRSYSVDSTLGSVNIPASVTLVNNGIEKWENCFFQSVSFGDMYLTGPKVTVDSGIEKLNRIEVAFSVVFTSIGTFKSNWRIFNSSGVPFGEVVTFEFIIH